MKTAEISFQKSVYKKLVNTSNDNYQPISTLSNFTKFLENILFFETKLLYWKRILRNLTDFRKNHNTQNFLFSLRESIQVHL